MSIDSVGNSAKSDGSESRPYLTVAAPRSRGFAPGENTATERRGYKQERNEDDDQ
jgi:hypothetical protein